jgi:putative glycosyltransferase (TIGR04372 family)
LVRFGQLFSSRIGHLAGNTELYLCEKKAGINVPNLPYIDLFYSAHRPICNKFLLRKISKKIHICPKFLIHPLFILNEIIPGGEKHKVGTNSNHDRDIHNLLDKYPPHLSFTNYEEDLGKEKLKLMGLPPDAKFVCLLVRDSAYLSHMFKHINWSYHNYRDCNIENYLLCAEELTKRNFFVFRMGAKVGSKLSSSNPMIIDYANSSFRSEFLDLYLGAKCEFCISTSSGWDAVPMIFRKPIIFAPFVPLGYLFTFSSNFHAITKHHIDIKENRELTFKEIFERGVGFCMSSDEYKNKGILLKENTPEEIRDIVIEYLDKKNGIFKSGECDELFQQLFWKHFPTSSLDDVGAALHGQIKSFFGVNFLRNNKHLLDGN